MSIYSRDFQYEDDDGVTKTITLNPLLGEQLKLLFKVAAKIPKKTEGVETDGSEFLPLMADDSFVDPMMKLCRVAMADAMPSKTPTEIDRFVSIHLFRLFPLVVEMNLHVKK